MPGEKKIEKSELSAPSVMADSSIKLPEKNMGKVPSNSISSGATVGNSVSGIKGPIDQPSGVYYPPTSCYDYRYPGYNGTFAQSDDKSYMNTPGGAYTGIQHDNTSMLYYLPGYGPYAPGSSEYLQQPCSFGSEAFPCYTYDLAYARNGLTGGSSARSGSVRSSLVGPSGSGKSNGIHAAKSNNNLSSKTSALPFNSRFQQPTSHLSRLIYQQQQQQQSINPLNKISSGFQPSGLVRGFNRAGKFSPSTNRNGYFSQYNPVNYQSNDRVWNNNFRYRSKENFGKSGEIKALIELTRGPRADNKNNSSKSPSEVEQLAFAVDRNKFNLQDFQTEYDNAKFYVIKSYSEDDIHRCIKYDVWSSTPNGNRKLDAAYCEAEAKTNEDGKKCPVFLFFSVNGSGQFVGIAEMIGQVDFSKNKDFWQLDKWNGFFPIKWHIIKDVPNPLLRHIILENNDSRPVTYSRDTQEIGLKQGLEMLSIFKSYSERTSVLDDFNFYENREKSFKAKRNARPASQTDGIKDSDHEKKHFEAGEGIIGEQSATNSKSDPSSLVSLTKSLSLNSQQVKS